MQNLDRIYDSAFFEEWGPAHEKYVQSAKIITDVLHAHFKPEKLADLGCGCGVYSHLFGEKGVSVVAIDGSLPPPDLRFPVTIHVQDLTVPFQNSWGAFDTALCLEVAEHIPEEDVGTFLQNITQFSDRLILSAAPPGQGGHHHVNEQPKRYWVQKLASLGYVYNRKLTGRLFETFYAARPPYVWMGEHISIYERAADPGKIRRDMPFGVRMKKL